MFKQLAVRFALGLSCFFPAASIAQQQAPQACGTEIMVKELMKRNPDYARQVQQHRQLMREMANKPQPQQRQLTNYVIPVVVHIMHDDESWVSDAQVYDAMRILNEDFNAASTDLASVIPDFQPIIGNVGIEFRLAKKDENGNCTNGITRTLTNLTNEADDNVKDLIRWNPDKYLNVWVVKNISFGAGGYSYYPCPGSDIDGIVILASQFGSIGASSPQTLFRSLSHEVGHYLDLPHTWGNSNTPGLASNCSDDDGVWDTPNTVGVDNLGCNLGMTSCGGILANVQNIMDYSMCQIMFTIGQKNAMINSLQYSCRSNLISQGNLMATGTNDGYSATACAPIVEFLALERMVCTGTPVQFTDRTYNDSATSAWTWNWQFPGGNPSSSTDQHPVVVYNVPGTYQVSLTVTNPGGTDSKTKTNYIVARAANTGLEAPLAEDFESATFPAHPTDVLKNWTIEGLSANNWERTDVAAAEGNYSMRIRNHTLPDGTESSLLSPNINFSTIPQPRLYFKVAYASQTGNTDQLRVFFSSDCGKNWTMRYSKTANLATAPPVGGNFVPTESQWRQEVVSVPTGSGEMMVKFVSNSSQGGTIYLDSINIRSLLVAADEQLALEPVLEIYPNPNNGQALIRYQVLHASSTKLSVVNSIGQEIVAKHTNSEEPGQKEVALQHLAGRPLAPGVYFVRLQTDNQVISQKLVVN